MASTVVPKIHAIAESESPAFTLYFCLETEDVELLEVFEADEIGIFICLMREFMILGDFCE